MKIKYYKISIAIEVENQRALGKEIGEFKADREYQIDIKKVETETQNLLKEDKIWMKEEGINFYKEEKKLLKEKLRKLNEKEKNLVPTR
ncbi:hypothetical protein [Priestia endophytica]|uniref:hypothetical protein n=1 Tax=Priestia endophytica TaxID=135735 RepID=UPI0022809123|nr:hypothetical protein [Priestia endophytica]MCY8233012.1 hypothetical protein [Priestia endophytica]